MKRILPLILILILACTPTWARMSAMSVGGGGGSAADVTAPTVSTATIGTNGTTLTLGMSESVTRTAGTFDVDCSTAGSGLTCTYSSGSGSNSLVYTIGTTVYSGDTCDLDYDGAANGIEDAAGNDLAAITSKAMTNNSTQVLSTCTQRYTDDFNRSDSTTLGGGWTEPAGDLQISTNRIGLANPSGSIALSGTALTTATQYAKATMLGSAPEIAIALRMDGSDFAPRYLITASSSGVEWNDEGVQIQTSASLTFTTNDKLAIVIRGTGDATIVSIWKNPTENKPFSGGSVCTDTAKPCWDNAGDAPDLQFTNNPTNPANANTAHGISLYFVTINTESYLDDYFAGDCSD